MEKNLYIDASHPNETRIVLKSENSIEEYEFEDKNNLKFKNNIYLGTISRVEPSLQAAFINFGREKHGFLAFNDIQSDYYQIPLEDKEKIMELLKLPDSAPAAAPSQEELDAIEDPLYVPPLTVPTVIYERDFGGRFIFENHILSQSAPPEHAVRRVLPIGFYEIPHSSVEIIGEPRGFGKKRSKKEKAKKVKASGKVSRRR